MEIQEIFAAAFSQSPVVTPTVGNLIYNAGDGAVAVDGAVMVMDVDDANASGATVTIAPAIAPEDVLGFTASAGITGSYVPAAGVLTLMGTATIADYQTVFQSVTYENTNPNPILTPRVITFELTDERGASGSDTRNISITNPNCDGTSFVWDNDAGDFDWNNVLNWDCNSGIPAAGDTATFTDNGVGTVDLMGAQAVDTIVLQNTSGNDYTFFICA